MKIRASEVFYHEYESMCADNDFCEHARQDGVVIDARHLFFEHRHPLYGADGNWRPADPATWDEAYKAQNSERALDLGLKILERRRAAKFAPLPSRRSVALCIPGDDFKGAMLDSLLSLQAHLIAKDWDFYKVRGYTSNVYVTREEIRRVVMKQQPELCLWLDHDNPITPEQFDQLLLGLDAHLEVDGIAGWCWIHDWKKQGFTPSCGNWAPDHLHWTPFPPSFARGSSLQPFECGGFPCFLMRFSALDKGGRQSVSAGGR